MLLLQDLDVITSNKWMYSKTQQITVQKSTITGCYLPCYFGIVEPILLS
jgi:hypothetical protein